MYRWGRAVIEHHGMIVLADQRDTMGPTIQPPAHWSSNPLDMQFRTGVLR